MDVEGGDIYSNQVSNQANNYLPQRALKAKARRVNLAGALYA
ncbi:hypothetical protein Mettu_3917 [Methylobacter tundripaludum SV96]|uniref:Uncharacterized protein n=1 Tax=Methylobacter tundripaludum (strain ATCC BAA-1195 / DSM 17260 / SV96) TaxID=697282 RepID=G3J0P6_METTV|nr:hypothetical protein Mettu_3917 [Methylobacter tundripaludum SV96]